MFGRKVKTNSQEIRKMRLGKLKSLSDNVKSDFNVLKLLSNLAFYKIEVNPRGIGRGFRSKFMKKYKIEALSLGGALSASGKIVDNAQYQVSKVDDVYFISYSKTNPIDKWDSTHYLLVPIWQRKKAKAILERVTKELSSTHMIFSDGRGLNGRTLHEEYDLALGQQHQYVRKDVYDRVDAIFKRLIENPEYYKEAGKRLKETFLLHGAPGTGKTSLVTHFAAKYNLHIAVITPQSFCSFSDALYDAVTLSFGKPVLVLLEDLDATEELLLKEYQSGTSVNINNSDKGDIPFSYSLFINKLDGAKGLDNCVVCLSTNYREKLIPSIYRPGRVDHSIELLPLTSEEISLEVKNEMSEYIQTFDNGTFAIANIADLKLCKSKEEVDEVVKWIKS